MLEFARIASANVRDYIPRKGDELDLHRLNLDQTAAIENVIIEDFSDPCTGGIRHHVQLRLHDKVAALNALAKHLGLLTERTSSKALSSTSSRS